MVRLSVQTTDALLTAKHILDHGLGMPKTATSRDEVSAAKGGGQISTLTYELDEVADWLLSLVRNQREVVGASATPIESR